MGKGIGLPSDCVDVCYPEGCSHTDYIRTSYPASVGSKSSEKVHALLFSVHKEYSYREDHRKSEVPSEGADNVASTS